MQDVVIEPTRPVLQTTPGRPELYTPVHKGLRAAMSDALLAVGRLDADDATEVSEVLARVRGLLALCRDHLEHEERAIHTAMEARCPGSAAQTASDHREHLVSFIALEAAVQVIEQAPARERAGPVLRLYRQLAVFVGENFLHMHVEETENTSILWQTHSDPDLAEIHRSIVSVIPPERMAAYMRWMVPYQNPAERAAMLAAMQRTAPAHVVEGLLAAVRPHLSQRDWEKLAAALGRESA